MAQHNEIEFEKELCEHLAANGWMYSTNDTGYDRERALFPEDLFGWLKRHPTDRVPVPARVDTQPKTVENYGKVRVRVMRQVHFSTADQSSVDLLLFVNGLPVATLELRPASSSRSPTRSSSTRPPPAEGATNKVQPLFGSGTRALVRFAASNDEVWMTTELAGDKTYFLPFKRGTGDGGAGNPLNPNGSPTSYLWERVLQRDSWLNILGRFMYIKHESTTDPISGKTTRSSSLRFPRFQQWEAVTNIADDGTPIRRR